VIGAIQDVADGLHFFEVYFGTEVDIVADQTKAVDVLSVSDLGRQPRAVGRAVRVQWAIAKSD
jgi:hypothetical protein